MDKTDIIGNLTTIAKICIMTIAPFLAIYIGTDEQTVAAFLTACLTFILAVFDAKYPNTIFTKTNTTITESPILNDEYEYEDDMDE